METVHFAIFGKKSILHLFWKCDFVSVFWGHFKALLQANCGLKT